MHAKGKQWANAPAENAKEHYRYRLNILLPVVDAVTSELTRRFPDNYPGKDLLAIPSWLGKMKTVLTAAETYEADLPSPTCLGSQLVSWRVRWAEVTDVDKPSSALEALNRCNPETYSNIQALLKLLSTLPLTSCDAERTFSALKRMKTVGRSTMGEGPPRGSPPHEDPQEDPCRRCSGRQNVPQEERHLHPLKVKQREVGYRACWLDARAGPAWRNRPLQAEREGADVCMYLPTEIWHTAYSTARASRRR